MTTAALATRTPSGRRPSLRLVGEAGPAGSAESADCSAMRVPGPCDYRLRVVEFEDGAHARRFECDACGAIDYR